MKIVMLTSWKTYFSLICLIWAICDITGTLSVPTKSNLPKELVDKIKNANGSEIRNILHNSRRIIFGSEALDQLPYMVYLKLPSSNSKFQEYKRWLCGGVIVHEEYILTSAACIEDVKHFYVVSGTYKFNYADDRYNNPCIKNGAKKAVWKCIPRNYVFDGHENDNIRWMNNDIAVVKLEDEFDFTRRVRGCDFVPRPVCYNNESMSREEPGTALVAAGWGSTERYNDWVNTRKGMSLGQHMASRRHEEDQQNLLQAPVYIMHKHECKKRWGKRYYNIIQNYMICTEDFSSDLSEICAEKYVDCHEIVATDSDDVEDEALNKRSRRYPQPGEEFPIHSSHHNYSSHRRMADGGGFCENDHGGPLVHGTGISSVVVGIISACLVKEKTNKCYGPFLYTSVYKNRVLLNCAIYKIAGQDCNKFFRAGSTHTEVVMSWNDHPDGPAKTEVPAVGRRKDEELPITENATNTITHTTAAVAKGKPVPDAPNSHAGIVLRSHDDEPEKKEVKNVTVKHEKASNKTAA
ncbi:hypothetical protein O0L34_g6521 [Tuta absoluta]|nr:hypothetical protein O0L34_g6521 [Tuta absoluta]